MFLLRVKLLILGLISTALLAGCVSDNTVTVAGDDLGQSPVITPDAAPTMAEMQQVLQDELERLGKSTMAVGEYSAPTGDMNIPFDLHAQVIDPDGEGGADPLGVHVSWTERLIGDYNMDGLVNASDLTPLGQYYGRTIDYRSPATVGGVEDWPDGTIMDHLNPDVTCDWRLARIDGNGDGLINMQDITPIGQHWQERITSFGFMLYRDGGVPQPVRDPENDNELYLVDFGITPIKEIYGDRWPNAPLEYEIDLPIDVSEGDSLFVNPRSGSDYGLLYEAECTLGNLFGTTQGPIPATGYAIRQANIVHAFLDDEFVGRLVCAEEYLCGDLDGNAVCNAVESVMIYYYYNCAVSQIPESERDIVDRLDWSRDGFISISDLSLVGNTYQHRLDGIALTIRDGYDDVPVMDEADPGCRLVIPRKLSSQPNRNYLFSGWLPASVSPSEIGVCLVSSSADGPQISRPRYFYGGGTAQVSSRPSDGLPVVCIVFRFDDELTGRASYSNAGVLVEYAWDIDASGSIEHYGDTLDLDEVSAGEHVITLRVTDDQCNTAETSMTVTIPE